MKTYKPKTYGFSLKSFGLQGKTYLTATILVYFDLRDPEAVLSEQQLWTDLPDQLGSDTLPDMGFPKPHGELLVTGSCYAQTADGTAASEVSIKLANLEKRLLVFGDRVWKAGNIPSSPRPFAEMPLKWLNSFGGSGYERNPLGKGFTQGNNDSYLSLPNIESPDQLIGSPKDRPQPAGFAPLDMMWPQRFSKGGSYGGNWQKERWPWFPDDFNPEFFNTAPEDQYIPGFFQGQENLEIRNMHPELPLISSHLPGQRPRCFITRRKTLEPGADTEFVELHSKLDTVWLFPSILRGLLFYRGTMEVLDDEYGDIERIYVAAETMDEPEKSMEYYHEEQKKFWNRIVNIDMAPFEAAKKKVADTLMKTRQLPKQIQHAKLKAKGKAPRMQRSPEEIIVTGHKTLAGSYRILEKQEKLAQKMHLKHGHLVKIDLEMFSRMRNTLDQMKKKLDQTLGQVQNALKKGEKTKAETAAHLKKSLTPEQLTEAGIDPDDLLPTKKVNPWHDRGFPLVIGWRKKLEQDEGIQNTLKQLGFADHTIKRGWFGLSAQKQPEQMADWGRKEEEFIVPSGLVLPRFNEATLIEVRVRPGTLTTPDNDVLIPDSKAPPLFLAALDDNAPVIHVQDELTAWLVEQEIGDVCSILAMDAPNAAPDKTTAAALKDAPLIISVGPDVGDGTAQRWDEWKKTFKQARPAVLPVRQDLFDIQQKEGIRSWLMQFLPEETARANNVDITLPEPGKPPAKSPVAGLALPEFDVKGMVKDFQDDLKAFHQPEVDRAEALKKELKAKTRKAILEMGKDPDKILNAQPAKKSLAETGKEMSDRILAQKKQLQAKGMLTPENGTKMTEAAAQTLQMGRDGEKRYQEGMQKLAAAREKIAKVKAGELPDDVQAKFAEKGIDPDQLKLLSREEVQARHEQGMSLAGANIRGLDLSGLDLSGIDLTKAMCGKTDFAQCNLQGALFDQTLAQEANFTEADLRGAILKKAILSKVKFNSARLEQCELLQAIVNEADFTGAKLGGVHIYMSMLQKVVLHRADLREADLEMSMFSEAQAADSDFRGARIRKCLFKGTVLDRVNFSGASFPATLFSGATGKEVNFSGADLSQGRMGRQTVFRGADFTGISMNQGSFMDSDLSGSNFSGAVLSSSIIENCDMSRVNLAGVSAKNSRFKRSNLEHANMSGLNLFCGSLKKARLVETDLSFANLFGVDFFKCIMGNTRLDGANLKRTLLHNRTEYLP